MPRGSMDDTPKFSLAQLNDQIKAESAAAVSRTQEQKLQDLKNQRDALAEAREKRIPMGLSLIDREKMRKASYETQQIAVLDAQIIALVPEKKDETELTKAHLARITKARGIVSPVSEPLSSNRPVDPSEHAGNYPALPRK